MLAVLATIVVIGLNVDTVSVATRLWHDPALRQSLAAQASQIEAPDNANAARDEIEALGLPVGWGDNAPDSVVDALPGWIIAIAALNLGAPFWFDLLSRVARLRGSGLQERPRALSDTTATERPERKPIVAAGTPQPVANLRPAAGRAGMRWLGGQAGLADILAFAKGGGLGVAAGHDAGRASAVRLGSAVQLTCSPAVLTVLAAHIGLLDDPQQRLLGASARLQKAREIAALTQLRI